MGRRRLPVVLDKTEAEALLAQPNTDCPTGLRNRAILELAYRAGLRVSELVKLRPANIRWREGLLEIRNGKGGRDRNVPVGPATLAWLRAWKAERPAGRTFFGTLKGGPLSARYLQQLVKRLAVKALGEERGARVHPHTLRHSYATSLLDDGFTIREVQDLLGHASVATTQVYLHVRPGDLAAKIRAREESPAEGDAGELAATLLALPAETRAALARALLGGPGHGKA